MDVMQNNFKLGFGLMRLPKRGAIINVEETKRMVDMFIEAGGTYFDTAYVYLGSETATRKALVERYPRESFALASKLNVNVAPTEKLARAQLKKSLERTGAGYFDFYLLHCILENNYKRYESLGLWDLLKEQKQKGVIKHIGFSYHSGPELLDRILTDHPEAEMVQLQLNYADWEDKSVTARANYEVALKHNKPIVIMEPVKGGRLADPPEQVKKLFKTENPDMSYASWAIRYAASLQNVLAVLSGMSNVEQMQDNLSYMKNFTPLSDKEYQIIYEAQRVLNKSATIPCTACRYCEKGCPKQIKIPDVFAAYNKMIGGGNPIEAKEDFLHAAPQGHAPVDCVHCRQCENVCPQHLEIVDLLGKANASFK